jgi:serine/threonine-protein kinase RsbW
MMSPNAHSTTSSEGFVTLHIPSRYGYLRIVRQSIMDTAIRAGLTEFDAAQLEMAVDESCANIIEHSYGGEARPDAGAKDAGIHINLIQQKNCVVVEIFDYGKGFDFENYQFMKPDQYLDGEHDRGLGMYIIHKFVDELSYERGTASGNCLKLVKCISGAPR